MEPKLSVIIPVYNVESYLNRCVDSIRNQSLPDLEIILIDDGSTDSSGRICAELARKDSRIIVIYKHNEGQGIAKNYGLEIATGKYVAFVDSDDYMEKDAYEFIINQIEKENAQLACYGYTQDDSKGKSVYQSAIKERIYQKDEVKKQFLLHFFGDDPKDNDLRGVSACMSVYRRDIICKNKIRFLSERKVFSEDTIFNLDYCKHINKAITCQRQLYHYCLKEDSFTKGYQEDRWKLTVYFTKILKGYAGEYGIEEEVSNRIRMILWVSLMDSVKQEVRLIGSLSYKQVKSKIRCFCNQAEVRTLIGEMNTEGLNKKQILFYWCMKHKCYGCLMLLSYLRNRRGL